MMSLLDDYLKKRGQIISISGSSGTGKTTLALQIVAGSITANVPFEDQCLWIQASESFPKKRLESMLRSEPSSLNYVLKNTFIKPSRNVFHDFDEQTNSLHDIVHQELPPNVKFIVIDNISHHLRYRLAELNDFTSRSKIVNKFFDEILFPLIMFCKRNQIHLILIHEVSQDPHTGKTRSFYHKLFNRIQGISITLTRPGLSMEKKKSIQVEFGQDDLTKSYILDDIGLVLIT
ncbi:MAG: AAA family ATPase [Candidatus Lokiarchaeota archaeon]|nr:AAA family ATPase [Candidatus Lokiarchaeota archaeon]